MKTTLLEHLYRKLGEGLGLLNSKETQAEAGGFAPPSAQQAARAEAAFKRMRARSKQLGVSMSAEEIVALVKSGRRSFRVVVDLR